MIASFDIFDTALIRRCGGPQTVWWLMASRLWPDDPSMRTSFIVWRRFANSQAGPSLSDIYAFSGASSFTPYTPRQLAEAEMEEERRQLTANPDVSRIIASHRAAGDSIAFVSDMYLPSSFLGEVLASEGLMAPADELYVSCEHGARKDRKGALFSKVFGKRIRLVHHYGDNPRSDRRMARAAGAHATLVSSGFTGTERRVCAASGQYPDGWQLTMLAGASRAVRLTEGNTPAVRIAADFVAPVMVAYMAHVIDSARARGIRRLYFINRDGWILHRIAEALPHHGLELRYFYASRRSLLPAYLAGADAADFLAIADGHSLVGRRPDDFLAYFGTDCRELNRRFNLSMSDAPVRNLSEQERWLNLLFGDTDVHSALTGSFAAQARLLGMYLRQEGFDDDILSAMVDVGWFGSSRLMLNAILARQGMPQVFTYYLGARRDMLPPSAGGYDTFLDSMDIAPSVSATGVIESYFCACPEESTASYELDASGKVIPVGNGKSPSSRVKSIAGTNAAVCRGVCDILRQQGLPGSHIMFAWMKISIKALFTISEPDIDIRAFTGIDNFDDRPMASRLSPVQLMLMCLTGKHDITGFDKASLAVSVPRALVAPLWALHRRAFAMRVRAYRLYRDLR